mmetsp:Transcript_43749/g.121055  ORF Transcript_43749/g.121055 Transcript_43749/m.121055 type:complete len:236 (-) Transcript_43749:1863-2570(-)
MYWISFCLRTNPRSASSCAPVVSGTLLFSQRCETATYSLVYAPRHACSKLMLLRTTQSLGMSCSRSILGKNVALARRSFSARMKLNSHCCVSQSDSASLSAPTSIVRPCVLTGGAVAGSTARASRSTHTLDASGSGARMMQRSVRYSVSASESSTRRWSTTVAPPLLPLEWSRTRIDDSSGSRCSITSSLSKTTYANERSMAVPNLGESLSASAPAATRWKTAFGMKPVCRPLPA